MEPDRHSRKATPRRPGEEFAVTCTIGTIRMTDTAGLTPVDAAMLLIAAQDMPGTFHFSVPGGASYAITVEVNR